jgi:protein gp37
MLVADQHTFYVLTKRPERMYEFVSDWVVARPAGRPPRNIWLGVTAENQRRADERIPILLQTPAAVRFVSLEPLLGPIKIPRAALELEPYVDLSGWKPRLNWVIVGAETGPGKRPMDRKWAEALLDQCQSESVPFFFKKDSDGWRSLYGRTWEEYPNSKGA